MSDNDYILEMRNIEKSFSGVRALKGVQFNVKRGEIHSLIGENGAGKSTLMKCIIGIQAPTSGEMFFDGKEIKNFNTQQALEMGIAMIHQELSPVEHRTVMENLWLGREPVNRFGLIDHKKMYEMSLKVLKEIDCDEDPRTLMVNLSVAKMQMIEIAKAISYNAKLIIMDEPTSTLTNKEVEQLFVIARKLRKEGKSIVYISHKLNEIFELSDRITVFRDGEYVDTKNVEDMTVESLINMMVGRDVTDIFPKIPCDIGDVKLEVKNLTHRKYFKDISFTVRKGEIFGIAGLMGAGRTEIIETIFGMRQPESGEVFIDGKKVHIKSPMDAIDNKMAFLTEDRRSSGIFPILSVEFNMAMAAIDKYVNPSILLNIAQMQKDGIKYIDDLSIKTNGLYQRMETLSGGNQQKVLVARWLLTEPDILFLDEPTRGIDVGAKSQIHSIITKLAGMGKSIVMISSELPEVMGMSDRIMIVQSGKVTGIIENSKDLTQDEIMKYATGMI